MVFFHNAWSTIGAASKIVKKPYDHNDGLSNGRLKTEPNAIFMLLSGSTTQQEVIFMSKFFGKSVILLQ